jgi:hypothetical protein
VAYRLRCAFDVPAYPKARHLERAKIEAGLRFIRDMEKRGWRYLGHGLELEGPAPALDFPTVPKRSHQTGTPGEYVIDVPPLSQCEAWRYRLAGLFVRPEIPIEVHPNGH